MKKLINYKGYALYILLTCISYWGCTNEKDVLEEIFREQANLVFKYSKLYYDNLNAGNIKVALAYGDSCKMAYYAEQIVFMKMHHNGLCMASSRLKAQTFEIRN